jgi:hypothetical protein
MLAMQKSRSAVEDEHGDTSLAENVTKEIFTSYVCKSIDRGKPHPGDIAEASSLRCQTLWVLCSHGCIQPMTRLFFHSAIQLPPSTYPLCDSIPAPIVEDGKLSSLQLEGILCASTKHLEILPSGERACCWLPFCTTTQSSVFVITGAGFFIGDGAGVGKGRQIAGVIIDNYARGRRSDYLLAYSSAACARPACERVPSCIHN